MKKFFYSLFFIFMSMHCVPTNKSNTSPKNTPLKKLDNFISQIGSHIKNGVSDTSAGLKNLLKTSIDTTEKDMGNKINYAFGKYHEPKKTSNFNNDISTTTYKNIAEIKDTDRRNALYKKADDLFDSKVTSKSVLKHTLLEEEIKANKDYESTLNKINKIDKIDSSTKDNLKQQALDAYKTSNPIKRGIILNKINRSLNNQPYIK